jgi:hypothetical protein
MALAIVGETCAITFGSLDYRCYEFTISKTGSRIPVKAFVDGVGVNPELVTATGKELACKFYDDVSETFALNSNYLVSYTIGTSSTAVSGYFKCLDIQAPVPAAGIADFTVTFKGVPSVSA